MIPLIPLQFTSFKTNLTMEQAIAVLGRSLPLKREAVDNGERVSFKYRVPHYSFGSGKARIPLSGIMIYVRYYSDIDGVHAKMTILPSVTTMLFFIFSIGFTLLISPENVCDRLYFFVPVFLYILVWWETIDAKKAVRSMFHDSIIE